MSVASLTAPDSPKAHFPGVCRGCGLTHRRPQFRNRQQFLPTLLGFGPNDYVVIRQLPNPQLRQSVVANPQSHEPLA